MGEDVSGIAQLAFLVRSDERFKRLKAVTCVAIETLLAKHATCIFAQFWERLLRIGELLGKLARRLPERGPSWRTCSGQDSGRERSIPEPRCLVELAPTHLARSKDVFDGGRGERRLDRADMRSEPLHSSRAKGEFLAKLLRVVRLEIDKRSIEDRKTRLVLRRKARQCPDRLLRREDIDVREQFRNGCAIRNPFPEVREIARGKRTLFSDELFADRIACLNQLVEEVEAERPEGYVGPLREVDGRTPRIEYAHP